MTTYRKIQVQQDAYMVTCDNCGKEDGPFPSPGRSTEPHYCGHCGHICRQNAAFEKYKHLKGARVVGFRFSGNNDPEVNGIVLQKGNQTFEIWSPGRDEDGYDHTLDVHSPLKLVASCYMFKPRRNPRRKR